MFEYMGYWTFISVIFLLSDWLFFFFIVVAESSMQKLSHALRILSETEKQLRISKNQTTWFTAALLQLSSIEYSSVDANDSKLCIRAASNRGRFDFFLSFLCLIPRVYVWFQTLQNHVLVGQMWFDCKLVMFGFQP